MESYVALNPDTFEDRDAWTYRDLQRLCKRVGLKQTGKREVLVRRLQHWNRAEQPSPASSAAAVSALADSLQAMHLHQPGQEEEQEEELPMNVVANRFAMLPVHVEEDRRERRRRSGLTLARGLQGEAGHAEGGQRGGGEAEQRRRSGRRKSVGGKQRRSSLVPKDANAVRVSPSLLKPLARGNSACDCNATGAGDAGADGDGRGLRFGQDQVQEDGQGQDPQKENEPRGVVVLPRSILKKQLSTPERIARRAEVRTGTVPIKRIAFSPFNGVKMIPHRLQQQEEEAEEEARQRSIERHRRLQQEYEEYDFYACYSNCSSEDTENGRFSDYSSGSDPSQCSPEQQQLQQQQLQEQHLHVEEQQERRSSALWSWLS